MTLTEEKVTLVNLLPKFQHVPVCTQFTMPTPPPKQPIRTMPQPPSHMTLTYTYTYTRPVNTMQRLHPFKRATIKLKFLPPKLAS